MFCTSCGTKNAAENNFCRQCGQKLEKAAASLKISEDAFDSVLSDDEQVSALLERAYRQRKDNDLPGAIALCEEALRRSPDSTSAHSLLGQLYEAGGSREQAIRQYERVLELNPGSIADRVKLDELRGETTPRPARSGASRITLVDHDGSQAHGGGVFLAVGVALILILLGGVLALQMRPRSTETANTTPNPAKPNYDNGTPAVSNPGLGTAAMTGSGKIVTGDTAASSNPSGSNGQAPFGGPASSFPGYPFPLNGSSGPARTNRARPSASSEPGSLPGIPISVQPVSGRADRTDSTENDTIGGERVHLKVESDNNEGKGDQPVIPVIKGAVHQNPADGAGGNSGSGGNVSTANPPSADSRALISVGQDKMNRMDYTGAIAAFRKALPSSYDEAGYICEQIAHCYKSKSDNKNAIVYYDNAIQKYKELLSAGRQMEAARNGIRACENGKTICRSE